MAKTAIRNRVGELRKLRAMSGAELAARIGVSRQTIHSIEAGGYVPNTEVALHLARELEVTVDELFALETPDESVVVDAEVLSATVIDVGQAVRVCRVGDRQVAVPVSASPYYLPEADAVVSRAGRSRTELRIFGTGKAGERLVLAGCDPAAGLLTSMVEAMSGVEVVSAPASSRRALNWLKEGKVHVAGTHLDDPNLRLEFPTSEFAFVTFAQWEEGLVVAPGNPRELREISDLSGKNVRFVNREKGSGARALVDRLLKSAGVPHAKVGGYERVANGHLAAAYAILSGDADVCLATRSAARAFGLDFVALHSERYDLVIRRKTLELPAAKAMLDVLQKASLRHKLEAFAGYDTSKTGTLVPNA